MIFKNFLNIKKNISVKKDFLNLLKNQPQLFETLKPTYKYSYSKKKISKCCLYFEVKNTLVKFSLKNFLDHSLAQSGFIHFGIVSFKMYVSQQDLHTSNPQYIQEILERVLLL